MENLKQSITLAQSASALGAAILGFGLGAKWGYILSSYAIIVITTGAVLHIWGMYIIHMRNVKPDAGRMAKYLWIAAWVCLIALMIILAYLFINQ